MQIDDTTTTPVRSRSRGRSLTRMVASGAALAATCSLALPAVATAQPAPPQWPLPIAAPVVPGYEALAALAPSIAGSVATDAASPQGQAIAQVRALLATAPLSPEVKALLERVLTFLDGSGGGGPEIPQNGPVISQFLYPTIGQGCISADADSVGAALAVPGPADLPPPGPGVGQAGFVFTALGTAPLAATQVAPLTATWINIDNGRTGATTLTGEANINPDGPATLSGIADTGPGRVFAVVAGSISTQAGITCNFLPTIGLTVV